jgi:cobalt-zinc-cadmium efflux system outer membrane protein
MESSSAQTVRALTLDEVLKAARNNPDVSIARQSLAAAHADVKAADHAPAPLLTGKVSQIDLQNGIGSGNLAQKRFLTEVGLDWTWERGGKRQARTTAAERGVDAASADVDDVRIQQAIAAGGAFYDLMGAQERIEQVGAIERSAAQLSSSADRRQKAGDLSAQEATRTAIEAQRSQVDLRAAELDRERAQLSLAQLLGGDEWRGQAAMGNLAASGGWPAAAPPRAPANYDGLIDARADVRAAQARVNAAEAALQGANALRSADVTVGASLDHLPGTSTRMLELRAVVPLNWGYRFEGEIGRAEAMLTQSQEALAKTRRGAQLEFERLYAEASNQATRMQTYEKDILGRAQQVAEGAELAYRKGAIPLTDLLDARRTLRATQLDAIAVRIDHAKAALAWRLRLQPETTTP